MLRHARHDRTKLKLDFALLVCLLLELIRVP
jgi:hypothetical protein